MSSAALTCVLIASLVTTHTTFAEIDKTVSESASLSVLSKTIKASKIEGLLQSQMVTLNGADLPWVDTGLKVKPGQFVTFLLSGQFHYGANIPVQPGVAFWAGFGAKKPMFIAGQNTYTVAVPKAGPLYIARSLAEWKTPNGEMTTPLEHYQMVQGQAEVLIMVWDRQPRNGLNTMLSQGVQHPLVIQESQRLKSPTHLAQGWYHMWLFGDSEIFQVLDQPQHAELTVYTHQDVGILQKDVLVPLEMGTRVSWDWIVNQLPSDQLEDTPFTHDYISIAFEFDDGQDLTYMWSTGLEKGKHFRCPLPRWTDIETHMVVRNNHKDLGQWLSEERDIYTDYQNTIGGEAKRITRVWIIANTVFQQGFGEAVFKNIVIEHNKQQTIVL